MFSPRMASENIGKAMGISCKDVMVPSHVQKTVPPHESVATALKIIKASRARFLPVVDEQGTYKGVFSAPTLLRLLLPKAALIGLDNEASRLNMNHLGFLSLNNEDFDAQVAQLKDKHVVDHMSLPENIPVAAPDTPVMEGIFLIHRYKRHLMLVEPDTQAFVGTVSANSLLDQLLT
jgi:CBS domain-containing protein